MSPLSSKRALPPQATGSFPPLKDVARSALSPRISPPGSASKISRAPLALQAFQAQAQPPPSTRPDRGQNKIQVNSSSIPAQFFGRAVSILDSGGPISFGAEFDGPLGEPPRPGGLLLAKMILWSSRVTQPLYDF